MPSPSGVCAQASAIALLAASGTANPTMLISPSSSPCGGANATLGASVPPGAPVVRDVAVVSGASVSAGAAVVSGDCTVVCALASESSSSPQAVTATSDRAASASIRFLV